MLKCGSGSGLYSKVNYCKEWVGVRGARLRSGNVVGEKNVVEERFVEMRFGLEGFVPRPSEPLCASVHLMVRRNSPPVSGDSSGPLWEAAARAPPPGAISRRAPCRGAWGPPPMLRLECLHPPPLPLCLSPRPHRLSVGSPLTLKKSPPVADGEEGKKRQKSEEDKKRTEKTDRL